MGLRVTKLQGNGQELLNDLHHLNFSPKSRRVRWVRHVARVEARKRHTRFWWGNLKEREHLDLGLYGRIILEYISREQDERPWTGLIWLRIGTSGGM